MKSPVFFLNKCDISTNFLCEYYCRFYKIENGDVNACPISSGTINASR